jgi:outer membrane protein TolC
MLKKVIILTTITLSASLALANTTELSLVSSSVSKHPSVVEKANEITLQGISVDQILAEDGLKINLSTNGKLPIKHSKGLNLSRADDLDRDYMDGVVTFSKNLYDFGINDYKVDAEKSRKEALKLEYFQVFEVTLQKLLNTVNDVAKSNVVLTDLELSIAMVKVSIDKIKRRFTSGIGTLMDVRQAQLLLLDLETQMQTLQRDHNTKLVILRDEFGLAQSDLRIVNQTIDQFNKVLIKTRQGVGSMISKAITYQRSMQIIDLEKSALNSQIKSLKSENMPQLNATITGIAYDVTRGLDEYELYGGINLSMPLFDSGLSNIKQRGLTHRVKVQSDILGALNQDKSLTLNKLTKDYKNLQIEYNSALQKQVNLSEKLTQLTQRMAVVDEGLLTKLQTQLQLDKTQRDILAYPYYMQSLNIDYWSLNEQLLEKINIRPTH